MFSPNYYLPVALFVIALFFAIMYFSTRSRLTKMKSISAEMIADAQMKQKIAESDASVYEIAFNDRVQYANAWFALIQSQIINEIAKEKPRAGPFPHVDIIYSDDEDHLPIYPEQRERDMWAAVKVAKSEAEKLHIIQETVPDIIEYLVRNKNIRYSLNEDDRLDFDTLMHRYNIVNGYSAAYLGKH